MKYLSGVTTLRYNPERCRGCERCVEVCPHGVFEMDGSRARVTDRDLCMECGACALNCEFGAITVRAGVGCAAGLINGMVSGGSACCGENDSGDACGTTKRGCC